jgi:hypothetical protein
VSRSAETGAPRARCRVLGHQRGWSFGDASAEAVESPSWCAGRVIGAGGTVGLRAGRELAALRRGRRGDDIGNHLRGALTIAMPSEPAERAVVSAWGISLPRNCRAWHLAECMKTRGKRPMRSHLKRSEVKGTRPRQSCTGKPWDETTTAEQGGSQVLRRQSREPWALDGVPSADEEGHGKTGAAGLQQPATAERSMSVHVMRLTPEGPHAGG